MQFGIATNSSSADIKAHYTEYRTKYCNWYKSVMGCDCDVQRLEYTCGSYEAYEYTDGDIVYCDPPYEGTNGYKDTIFDHKAFYDWVATRPYPVYFSSYDIADTRFKCIAEIKKPILFNRLGNAGSVTEKLYCNRDIPVLKQLTMFDILEDNK